MKTQYAIEIKFGGTWWLRENGTGKFTMRVHPRQATLYDSHHDAESARHEWANSDLDDFPDMACLQRSSVVEVVA